MNSNLYQFKVEGLEPLKILNIYAENEKEAKKKMNALLVKGNKVKHELLDNNK